MIKVVYGVEPDQEWHDVITFMKEVAASEDIDISELEQSILMYVEPESIDELSVPNEIWQRAMEIKTGKFENNEFMNFQG